MKNLLYIFSLLLWSNYANAQFSIPTSKANSVPLKAKASEWNDSTNNWDGYGQHIYTYASNNITQEMILSYDGQDTFERYINTYDNSNILTSRLYERYDSLQHKFIPSYRRTISTTGTNPVIEVTLGEIYSQFNDTWREDIRVSTHTLADGTINYYNYEAFYNLKWNILSSFTLDISSVVDTQKRITTIIMNNYIDSQYKYNMKTINTHNMQNELLSSELHYWVDNEWLAKEKYELEYTQNKPFRRTNYKYNFASSSFIYSDRVDSMQWLDFNPMKNPLDQNPSYSCKAIYDNNNWLFTEKSEIVIKDIYGSRYNNRFVWLNNSWVPSSRYTMLYDNQKNIIQTSSENYSNGVWKIMYATKYNNTYHNNNLTDVIRQYYETATQSYHNEHKIEYSDYIQVSSTSFKTKNSIETKLYPNPSNTGSVSININMEQANNITLEVMDMTGKIVYKENRHLDKGLTTIHLDDLTKGLFFVVITSELGVSRTKMLVE